MLLVLAASRGGMMSLGKCVFPPPTVLVYLCTCALTGGWRLQRQHQMLI